MKSRLNQFLKLICCIFILNSCQKTDNWISLGSWGISPNGDNKNELFKLDFDTSKVSQMIIYDIQSHKEVLNVYKYQRNWWNGRYNNVGDLVPIGLYGFYLELKGSNTYFGYVYVKY